MARIPTQQTNFTAGELSRRLRGRTDIARYQNGADTMLNTIPVVQGGAMRRDGTRFVRPAKYPDKRSILVPFVFSASQSYMLELGDLYMRVFKDRAQVESSPGVPFELATPFTADELGLLRYAQSADTMWIASGTRRVRQLIRYADAFWALRAAPFDPTPFDENGDILPSTMTLSAATVGTGRTLTATGSTWLQADVGREVWGPDGGIAVITAYSSGTAVTVEITADFPNTAVPAGMRLRDSPRTDCTPSADSPVGAPITLTLAVAGWRATDANKHVTINGGLCKITAYTNATVVTAKILKVMLGITAAPSEAWALKGPVWNATDGFPQAVALYGQSLYLAGTVAQPQTIWRSRIGEYLNFQNGTDDDDAFAFTLANSEQNQIQHLAALQQLQALTVGGSFAIYGGVEKAITPTNIQADPSGDNGANDVRPLTVGKELMFAHRTGKTVHSLSYSYSGDEYQELDLSILSSHLTEPGITGAAYQQKPEGVAWLPRADGVMVSVTLNRSQEVIGWARHDTVGQFEAVATIPVRGVNELWCIVRREVGGEEVRYVEVFDPDLNTDCALTGTAPDAGATVWGGLEHLDGMEVAVKADGVNMARATVAGGEITIARPANAIEIGLPYMSRIVTLNPEVPGGGTIQGSNMSISRIVARLLDTVSLTINGQYVDFRQYGDQLLDRPPPVFTGDKEISGIGWGKSASMTFESDMPFDFHLLSVIFTLTANQ